MRRAHLKIAALLLCAAAAPAQFSSLAVTDDGSQVWFATNLRLVSELPQNPGSGAAIYRLANGAIQRVAGPVTAVDPLPYHYYAVGNPQPSTDGSVFAYTLFDNCGGGSACITFPLTSTSFVAIGGQWLDVAPLTGTAQVSRNGRYVLNAQYIWTIAAVPYTQTVQLHDLQGGTTVQPPSMPSNARQALTSDGRVLGLDPRTHALTIWSAQSTQTLQPAEVPSSAIWNDAGSRIVYEAPVGVPIHLRALDPATGRDILLASLPAGSTTRFGESISNDAAEVLYLAEPAAGQPAQAWIVHPDGTGARQLTSFASGVDEAVLSGDGRTAIAVTGGRLVSIDAAGGAVQELIPVTPTCSIGPGPASLAPGTLFPLYGTALDGGPLRLNGSPVPLVSVSTSLLWFQVPWEASPGTTATLTLDSASPFAGCSIQLPITGRSPYFFTTNTGTLVIHQDFSGLVTPQSPAQPGEVVTLYALGLGGVTPQPATGAVTPLSPLFPLDWPFGCYQGPEWQSGTALDVPFAGLAPGMVGIYQVNLRLPDPLPSGNSLSFNCGTPGNVYERGNGAIPIAGGAM